MAIDFRDGRTFPRRGRLPMAHFLWLARAIDKARAAANGTIGEYIYPCPIDKGVFARWGITPEQFDEAIRTQHSDDAIVKWATSVIPDDAAALANHWLVVESFENLDRQDFEEGAFAAPPPL